LPHHRVAAGGDQSTHVKRCSDVGFATPHATMTTESARIAV
jgi:hypothetical protein